MRLTQSESANVIVEINCLLGSQKNERIGACRLSIFEETKSDFYQKVNGNSFPNL